MADESKSTLQPTESSAGYRRAGKWRRNSTVLSVYGLHTIRKPTQKSAYTHTHGKREILTRGKVKRFDQGFPANLQKVEIPHKLILKNGEE